MRLEIVWKYERLSALWLLPVAPGSAAGSRSATATSAQPKLAARRPLRPKRCPQQLAAPASTPPQPPDGAAVSVPIFVCDITHFAPPLHPLSTRGKFQCAPKMYVKLYV